MINDAIKLLLVEDSRLYATVIKKSLKESKYSEFDVTWVESLRGAMNQFKNAKGFDVILLDLTLPDSEGINTVVKVSLKAPEIPILVTSSKEDEALEIAAIKNGAQDYLIKGKFSSFLLSRRIHFAMERQKLLKEIKESRKREIEQLETALANQQTLTGWKDTSVTAQLAGVGPLQKRSHSLFLIILSEYGNILDLYLEALGFKQTPPRKRINALANKIGDNGGGPQDVVDIHTLNVMDKVNKTNPKRARAYAIEGRLLALEVMGNLVDYYRQGNNK